jgi:hypothetical protein
MYVVWLHEEGVWKFGWFVLVTASRPLVGIGLVCLGLQLLSFVPELYLGLVRSDSNGVVLGLLVLTFGFHLAWLSGLGSLFLGHCLGAGLHLCLSGVWVTH